MTPVTFLTFSHNIHHDFIIPWQIANLMKPEHTEKITITLPSALYHTLRDQAYKQGVSLPEFIQKKIKLRPSEPTPLADLPLKELIQQTTPKSATPDSRLDFFS